MTTAAAYVARSLSPTTHTDTLTTCACGDPEVDQLRALISQGYTQLEASHFLWGDHDRLVSWPLAATAIRRQVQRMADDLTRARLPWLRLPERKP